MTSNENYKSDDRLSHDYQFKAKSTLRNTNGRSDLSTLNKSK